MAMDLGTAVWAKRKALADGLSAQDSVKRTRCSTAAAENSSSNNSNGIRIFGRCAPQFRAPTLLPNGMPSSVSLDDFKGRYLVILFYPSAFTSASCLEITGFNDSLEQFNALDCSVVVCSTDSEYAHYHWQRKERSEGGVGRLWLPMLSDRTRSISRSYNVLCEETGLAFRGLFVVDKLQRLRVSRVNPLLADRPVDEALRLVVELRTADGEDLV
ncbi:Peroxiredoxin-4 [Coemansia sp. BCRC 34490]|nr:Peroxiredoxin-4 [Coemansia sp. BCRC 34490]